MKIDLSKITTFVFIDENGKRHFVKEIGATLLTEGKDKTLVIFQKN